MIRELLTYFNSNVSKEARVFGHLYESIALIEREKRCRKHWLAHRTQCQNTIAQYLSLAKLQNKVLILGSGPLHEIPLKVLAENFAQVDLVDVVHLKETKRLNSHYKNVRFIEADITELESSLIKEKKALNKIPSLFLEDQYDLVISANLMSQLAYHLRAFLEKNAKPKLSSAVLDQFANSITHNHYLYLQKFKCPVILITDIESILANKAEEIVERETPYIDFTFPIPVKEWWWDVAPLPEFSKTESLKMKVATFIINP